MPAQTPYRTYAAYLKERFGGPTRKLSLHAGFSCPNRDGTLSYDGCIFCDPQAFSPHCRPEPLPLIHQLREGVEQGHNRGIHRFIAYFQAFTNTYGSPAQLKDAYDTIRAFPEIKGLAIGTRPDCLDNSIMALINSYTEDYEVWLELGLQSIHDQTLLLINRGHDRKAFDQAVTMIRSFPKIKLSAHVILGLPQETTVMEAATARQCAVWGVDAVKLHPLHAVKGTALAEAYAQGRISLLTQQAYLERVMTFLDYLPPTTIIERVTADCPRPLLVAPDWINDKPSFLLALQQRMLAEGRRQGRCWSLNAKTP